MELSCHRDTAETINLSRSVADKQYDDVTKLRCRYKYDVTTTRYKSSTPSQGPAFYSPRHHCFKETFKITKPEYICDMKQDFQNF